MNEKIESNMTESAPSLRERFRQYVHKMKSYEETVGVLYYDLRTQAPKEAVEGRAEVIGTLSTELFKLSTSEELGQYLSELSEPELWQQLDEVDRKLVEELKKEYDRSKKIPAEMYQEYVTLTSKAESVWEEAKEASDFARFQPYLEKIVAFNQRFVELWGYEGHPYNTLLDTYEPGLTVDQLDEVFGVVRERAVPLVAEIARQHQPQRDFLYSGFDEEQQKAFSTYILKEIGFSFRAGRLDASAHPFAIGLNLGDVRITTKYLPNDITFSLFSSIHEGGHALYEQNISSKLAGTPLCTGTSMAIHESQSRYWENKVGRSLSFWKKHYGKLQEMFPDAFGSVSLETFYKAINVVEPSLIRIEADELTYNLHIMIRYELEKALIGGELEVKDLPQAWNAKYEEYLGITPPNDAKGVLQDVHWSGGSFGYFPSYSLGNMYAAQLMHTMKQQIPDYEAHIEAGELHVLKDWLTAHIYQHGKLLTPGELIERITGQSLDPAYLVDYLDEKYRQVYSLES
ncbi:carboxypeptidase M32 [Marinicrinis sediminis]|uniref:Metal-dependent carboxypeptidase n=1 Tax=Marinicrinis sediminis TaxID=1652465 RepID=A0ABW5REI7_9BACL